MPPEPGPVTDPPRTDLDRLVADWNQATDAEQDEFLRRIGCQVHSRVVQSFCVDAGSVVRSL